MSFDLVLASASPTRAQMLRQAGLSIRVEPARVDEDALRASLAAEGAGPRDMADALAEAKARRIAAKHPEARVIGCDQLLQSDTEILAKALTREALRDQLMSLRGKTHSLLSAAVVYEEGAPVWRHVGVARMTMRSFSEDYLDAYLDRNWPDVSGSVGGYRIEAEGVRLFSAVQGDHFTILGLPLLALLDFLALRGTIPA